MFNTSQPTFHSVHHSRRPSNPRITSRDNSLLPLQFPGSLVRLESVVSLLLSGDRSLRHLGLDTYGFTLFALRVGGEGIGTGVSAGGGLGGLTGGLVGVNNERGDC